ncbi:uncharacterized protein N7511_006458 [Penicillium nucicola]|uniref:uncharacterized protein n=1 Tax=Penicillium nucicola TaxID=1850975 RepID=UPI0025452E7A|nr:uncharacterized protein N7511_006458 [Penicillium nucicola]KAJ5757764.1 hypothetical protein N7511_006458 [Penicillium nucicola]
MVGRGTLMVLWAPACFAATHAGRQFHSHLHHARSLSPRTSDVSFPGIQMFSNESLSDLGLSSTCEQALYRTIYCDATVSYMSSNSYVGNFDNSTLTALVCEDECEISISQFHDAVATNCGASAAYIPGLSFLSLVDQVWSNWNLTCLVDPTTGQNCNEIINAFPDVDDMSDLPASDLCSYCNVKQLAMMQENAYSIDYTEDWQTTYEYVAQTCNLTVADFNATQSAFNVTVSVETTNCVSGNTYTTEEGDTCDSIALAHDVSAATMFYINPNILNCSSIWSGTTLCLPETCEVYTVQTGDTCSTIAAANGLLTSNILSFNSQLNYNCSNLQSPDPYWGSTLCVSTPGGTYSGQAANTTSTEVEAVNPPAGVSVANGTVTDCSSWYVNYASENLTCAQICLSNLISINLFTEVNPSLGKTTCDSDLVVGDAYCVNPVSGWNLGSNANTTSATTSSATLTAASTPGAATQTGIPSNCNAYYIANFPWVANDTCATVAADFGITEVQFQSWNPAISSDCTSGFWAEEAYCVGVSTSSSSIISSIATSATLVSSTTALASSTSVIVPGPTQTGIPSNCSKYYVAQSGDDCATVAAAYGITEAQFLAWNPAVSSDCESGFWADEAYCVAVSS